jgi:hypothetical protein
MWGAKVTGLPIATKQNLLLFYLYKYYSKTSLHKLKSYNNQIKDASGVILAILSTFELLTLK